jgi:hypothetical protein
MLRLSLQHSNTPLLPQLIQAILRIRFNRDYEIVQSVNAASISCTQIVDEQF